MSFAKIAEARAVKKIVALIRREASEFHCEVDIVRAGVLADQIEAGDWKDIKLPKKRR